MVTGQLMSPVAPFFSDWLYKNLSDGIREKAIANDTPLRHESVHLSYLTQVQEAYIDLDLEQRMEYAQRISSLVLSIRKKEKIRVRQPLQKILLPVLDPSFERQVDAVKPLILAETNIKDVEYLGEEDAGFLKKRIKPNFKTLGRRLGKNMKAAAQIIGEMSQQEIARVEQSNQYTLAVNGDTFELTLEDFEISTEDIPGWKVATDGKLTVALDVTITEALQAEGMARELVNRIQNSRKNQDFNVTDRIIVQLEDHPAIRAAVEQFGDYIRQEVLADELTLAAGVTGEEFELPDEVKARMLVTR
jgi:isoleucyl-tRNA synthetase